MANFNVSFLNPALRKSGGSGVGVLADQLAILENSLGKDGFLSPGDYDILIEKAREIQMSNSLSADQRSNYDVKISGYEKAKEVSNLEKADDLKRITDENKNVTYQNNLIFGNNPSDWTKTMVDVYENNIIQLQDTIDRRRDAGQDATQYENELMESMARYQEKVQMNEAISNNSDLSNPIPGYVAYVTTNMNGEIVDVDYSRHGTKSGYAETNGMINGVQVYGKVNVKRDGENFFVLGNKIFKAVDLLIPDPANPGSVTPTKLMADVPKSESGITIAENDYVNMSSEDIPVQSYLPKNSWAKGVSGTMYKRREDGGYTKYINATPENLNITDNIFNLPSTIEETLMNKADETIDVTAPMSPDQGMNMSPMTDMETQQQAPIKMNYGLDNPFNPSGNQTSKQLPQSSMSNPTPSALDMPRANKSQAFRTPQQPSTAAASGPLANAKRTLQSGISAVKNLFS